MRNLLLATAVILLSTNAFAAVQGCEGVDTTKLVQLLETAVSEADIGKGPAEFNAKITGKNRLCAMKIVAASKTNGANLDKAEQDVALLVNTLREL